MYRIKADENNKLIYIELAGRMEENEWEMYIADVIKTALQFKKKELSILISLERLDTLPQDCIPICIKGLHIASEYTDKIAFVHKRVITRMQLKKILSEVIQRSEDPFHAELFSTEKEALAFLCG